LATDEPKASPWEVLGSEYLLKSPWRNLRQDRVRTHTGEEIVYSYLETTEAAFVVPVTTDGKIVLIRQFRLPVRTWTWEVVGGMIGDEPPIDAARRELREEVGGVCDQLVPLGSYFACAGTMNARHHAFLALDVTLLEPELEPLEMIEQVLMEPDEVFERARDGRIDDAQSALALLMAEPLVRAHLARRDNR
jgi:ADP-ribose pyrophosphatase